VEWHYDEFWKRRVARIADVGTDRGSCVGTGFSIKNVDPSGSKKHNKVSLILKCRSFYGWRRSSGIHGKICNMPHEINASLYIISHALVGLINKAYYNPQIS